MSNNRPWRMHKSAADLAKLPKADDAQHQKIGEQRWRHGRSACRIDERRGHSDYSMQEGFHPRAKESLANQRGDPAHELAHVSGMQVERRREPKRHFCSFLYSRITTLSGDQLGNGGMGAEAERERRRVGTAARECKFQDRQTTQKVTSVTRVGTPLQGKPRIRWRRLIRSIRGDARPKASDPQKTRMRHAR